MSPLSPPSDLRDRSTRSFCCLRLSISALSLLFLALEAAALSVTVGVAGGSPLALTVWNFCLGVAGAGKSGLGDEDDDEGDSDKVVDPRPLFTADTAADGATVAASDGGC